MERNWSSPHVCNHFSLGHVQYKDNYYPQASSSGGSASKKRRIRKEGEDIVPERTTLPQEESRKENLYWNDIQAGNFVLVKFEEVRGEKIYKYVCSVQAKDEEDGEVTVQGLRLKNEKLNEFIVENETDVFNVPYGAILQILEYPKILFKNR